MIDRARRCRLAIIANLLCLPVYFGNAILYIIEPLRIGRARWAIPIAAALVVGMMAWSLYAWWVSAIEGALVQVFLLTPLFVSLALRLRSVCFPGLFRDSLRLSDLFEGRVLFYGIALTFIPAVILCGSVATAMRRS